MKCIVLSVAARAIERYAAGYGSSATLVRKSVYSTIPPPALNSSMKAGRRVKFAVVGEQVGRDAADYTEGR